LGRSGGRAHCRRNSKSLVVDGIHNVIDVLEQLEMGKLQDIEFVEAQACTGGCVGGALTVINPFIGRMNLEALVDKSETRPKLRDELTEDLNLGGAPG